MKTKIKSELNRVMIKKYFECLRRRNKIEGFAKKVILDLLGHWRESRPPREGTIVYILVFISFIICFIKPELSFLMIILPLCLFHIRPPIDDYCIDNWLQLDRREIFNKVPNQLNVIKVDSSEYISTELSNIIVNKDGPINLSSGVVLEPDDFLLKQKIINSQDYFCEKGLDGKTRYSIHIFMVICLCNNFLAYYKCYWNFIRGVATLVETGEYLYDTVVSVRTEELSSAVLEDLNGKKLVMKEYLRIGTTDGKEIDFPGIYDTRIVYESKAETDTSRVKNAARIIRELLRQRRIDLQINKPIDLDE